MLEKSWNKSHNFLFKPGACKNDDSKHIGPVAQDFYSAFGTGDSDKTIATVDADGVALAAIQGLYQMLQEKDAELEAMKLQIEALKEKLE